MHVMLVSLSSIFMLCGRLNSFYFSMIDLDYLWAQLAVRVFCTFFRKKMLKTY